MKEHLLATLAAWILQALYATLRVEVRDVFGYFATTPRPPCLVAVWHNRILVLPPFFRRYRRGQRLAVLTSASRDGGLLSAVVRRFGLEAVRGSSSRRGGVALRELQTKLASGCDVIITPDGPRGPVYKINPGVVYLTGQTRLSLIRLQVEYDRSWRLRSWDGFSIPKPFSKVHFSILPGEPFTTEELENDMAGACARLAKELHSAAATEKMPPL